MIFTDTSGRELEGAGVDQGPHSAPRPWGGWSAVMGLRYPFPGSVVKNLLHRNCSGKGNREAKTLDTPQLPFDL